jgi:uncharacterized protein YraI
MRRLLFSSPLRLGLVLLGLCGAASAASAQDIAWTATHANLRTGPDSGYPRILTVPAGEAVEVLGCVDDWSWCDIYWRGERGWVSAGLLEYDYSGNRVDVYDYGVYTGWPVVTFVLGSYWHDHYHDRYWYRDRHYWQAYRPPPRPRPVYHYPHSRPDYPSHSGQHRPLPPVRPAQPGVRPLQPQARPPHLADRPTEQRRPQYRPPEQRPMQQRPPQHQRPQEQQGSREQYRPPQQHGPTRSQQRPEQRPYSRPAADANANARPRPRPDANAQGNARLGPPQNAYAQGNIRSRPSPGHGQGNQAQRASTPRDKAPAKRQQGDREGREEK